ncbi:hypothetical protein CJD36_014905 [Flavipsychrobacter stenotrophus]|uniref:Uncharacterized protein n=1 Tax=Flavipsychrobacter stenotrophus TaxID=2077091 RepID=A0A2S7STY4_9BACT|nr:tetratricopeptide repeat protein [Flavipsychrobacter stenotrophus]PQJ09986.1 hypothetical protein CJD36_014905 [Flavipsychrobacter stenotrophus]
MAKKQNQQNIQRPASVPKVSATPKSETPARFSLQTKLAILLGIIACLVYFNTLSNGYVLDDFTVIKNNRIITKGISAIGEIFTTPYRRGWFITHNDLYRPLSLVMFAIESDLGGGSPTLGHFMNMVVFASGVGMLFIFLNGLFDGKKMAVAFIAALLFALHPIHTEVVANIKSRDELLCFFFAFVSLNVFLKYSKTGEIKQLLLGALCFFLSFLSKETVITFLAVIPLIFFFYRNENKMRSIYITVSAVVVALLFLGIRFAVLSHYDANTDSFVTFMDNFLTVPPKGTSALATEILILGQYVKLLFVPYPLICDYSYNSIPFVTFGNIGVIISLAFYLLLGGFGTYKLIKSPKDPFAFAILFFLITISLFSNIPFIIGAAMAERFVFFASMSFCLVLALLIERFLMGGNTGMAAVTSGKVLAIIVPICLIYFVISSGRNKDWMSNETLFRADVVHTPNDARVNYYLGTELVTEKAKTEGNPVVVKQIIEEGCVYLRSALNVYPEYDDAHAAIGDAFFKLGRYDSAEVHDKRALELNPKFVIAMNNLAGVYFVRNQYDTAIMYCRRSIARSPDFVNAYANLGLCYMRQGKFDSSLKNLYIAISKDANFLSSYENMAFTYQAMGKTDSMRKYNEIAQELRAGGKRQ